MSIKFSCPHCAKALNVKDGLAGKKAQCPGCKKVLVIPSVPAGPDVEALAAAAFAEEERRLADQPVAKIEFVCPMCDEKIAINVALCGKQAPCPECRRIVKVPLLKKEDAKDWRQIDTRATSGIRLTEVKGLEGTWGTDSTAQVSRQALLEAKVIPTEKERLSWQGWLKRSMIAAVSIGILAIGTVTVLRVTKENKRNWAIHQVEAYFKDTPPKLPPAHLALAHRLAGDYYLKQNKPEDARSQFQTARAMIEQGEAVAPAEQDLSLIDLAKDQVGLGGVKAEIDNKIRFKWDEVQTQLRQTIDHLKTPEAKRIAIRTLTRQLIARGEGQRGAALAGSFAEDRAELEAIAGLELLRAKMNAVAEPMATAAQQALQPTAAQVGKPPLPAQPAPPALLALWYGLGQSNKARTAAPEASASAETKVVYQLGTIQGLGLEEKWQPARAAIQVLPTAAYRVQALADLAEIAADADQKDEAKSMVDDAAKQVEAEKGKDMSGWALWRLAELAGALGSGETGQILARNIADPALRQQALVDLLTGTILPDQLEAALGTTVDKNSLAYALALSRACQRQASQGDAAALQKAIGAWEPEKLRPIGYLGLALGLQAHNQ
ncbi:MAG TPA: hypothetical protein VGP68_15510 [Gemmataceae bacterium]|jgi:hypothetical protein|nr:hypothetical protein [Gemmataceae bacterium]